jgi:hypothetical protein
MTTAVARSVALAAAAFVAQSPEATIRITASTANIRSSPAADAPVLQKVSKGTYLLLLSGLSGLNEEGEWFRVQIPPNPNLPGMRAIGYVSKSVAAVVTGAEAAQAAEKARNPPVAPAPSPGPAAGDSIAVGAEQAGKTIWLKRLPTRAVSIPGAGATAGAIASNLDLLSALSPDGGPPTARSGGAAAEVTWVWVVAVPAPAIAVTTRRPSFYVTYGEVPGLNPDEWAPVLVRLAPVGSGWRFVSALAGPPSAGSRTEADWAVKRDLMHFEMKGSIAGVTRGTVRLTPAAPLEPGDYAVVIRPVFVQRSYSGLELLGGDGVGVAFRSAWPFSIK